MKKRFGFMSFSAVFLVLSAALALEACSPNVFTGSSKDGGIADMRNYRRINLACAGLNVANSELSVADFRHILHCFNSNGGLEPIENLSNRMSDADLRPIVDVGNRYIITNRRLLYQLEKTYNTLSDQKILDSTLTQFGRLLQNEEFVSSSIALLKEGYAAGDRAILLAVQQLSTKITYEGTATLLDVGLTLARSRAFGSLQSHFRGDSPGGRQLRDLTDQSLEYLKSLDEPEHVKAGLRLIEEAANGDLFQAMDEVAGPDPQSFHESIPRLASVTEALLSNNARIMDGVTSLFHYVHRPINCLKRSQQVPDGVMYVMEEMVKRATPETASFVKRVNPLMLMALAPLCELQPEIGQFYPAMFELADTTAIEPMTDLLKAFYRITAIDAQGATVHPLSELLADILADTGNGLGTEADARPENTSGIKLLLPTLAELTDRHVWSDALLLTSMPRHEDREGLQDALRFLTREMPGTEKSVYSALTDAVARATSQNLYNFVHSLGLFVNASQPLLDPSITALRHAYYVNDVHPLIDLTQAILADAPNNDRFFNTLFKISEMPEFKDSVRLVSDMSKDGRLKELLGALLTIFHKFSAKEGTPVHPGQEPAFVPRARHDFCEADLNPISLGDEPALSNNSCRKLDSRVSLGEYGGRDFDRQLGYFVSCLNADRAHGDFGDVVDFLTGRRDERAKNYLESTIDLGWALDMTRQELKFLGDAFIHAFDDKRLARLLDGAKMFIRTEVHGASDAAGAAGPMLRPLLDVFKPVMGAEVRPELHDLEAFAGRVLRRLDFPEMLKYVDGLLDAAPEPETRSSNNYDWSRIKRWIGNKECQSVPSGSTPEQFAAKRAQELTDDYDYAVTTWDLTISGQPRRDWGFDEFKGYLNDLLTKFGDPTQGNRPGAVTDALLNSLRYFTLPAGHDKPSQYQHYHPEELRKFLIDRSNDYKLISYFYPGESAPRVRLVNTMDRLELVLINADFWSPWPFVPGRVLPNFKNHRNFGLLFLGQIADAWGDEDESVWPQEIKDKFRGGRPPTLAQAVASMNHTAHQFEKLVGMPALPGCSQEANPVDPASVQWEETHDPHAHGVAPKWLPAFHIPLMQRYLFNIHQVLPVLAENLPVEGQPLGQGGKMANGMRILRDLFFQLYYSTPSYYQRADFVNTDEGWKNNLSVIMRLERAGFTRQITRNLRGSEVNDPAIVNFFDALLEGATSSDDPLDTTRYPRFKARAVTDALVDPQYEQDPGKPGHELFWKVVQQIFAVVDAAEGHSLDIAHQQELDGLSDTDAAKVREGWSREYARMKQTGFYTLAAAGPLGLVQPALKTLGPVLSKYNAFLSRNADKVESLLRSGKTSYFMRALYEDDDKTHKAAVSGVLAEFLNTPQNALDGMGLLQAVTEDNAAKHGLDLFADRWTALTETSGYRQLHMEQINRQLLEFLEQQSGDPNARAAARRLLDYLAERLEKQDLDQYFLLGAKDPNGFYQVLSTLGHYIDDGELMDFFQLARDALPTPPRR